MEIPIAYPQLLDPHERPSTTYIVNDVEGTIRPLRQVLECSESVVTPSVAAASRVGTNRVYCYSQGLASASWLRLPLRNSDRSWDAEDNNDNDEQDSERDFGQDFGRDHYDYEEDGSFSSDDGGRPWKKGRTILLTTSPVITAGVQTIAVCLLDATVATDEQATDAGENEENPLEQTRKREQANLKLSTQPPQPPQSQLPTQLGQGGQPTEPRQARHVTVAHLDLGSETRFFQDTVKVKAFAVGTNIQVTLIDTNGFVLSVLLSGTDLSLVGRRLSPLSPTPAFYLRHCFAIGSTFSSSSYAIRSPMMVHFLSSTHILVSLTPFLVAVDLDAHTSTQWSKAACLEVMRSRRRTSSAGAAAGIVGSIVGLFTGGAPSTPHHNTHHNHLQHDMNPVAAITAAENDPSQIFTLHSDGTVIRWLVPIGKLLPHEVYDLQLHPRINNRASALFLPPPDRWSDDYEALHLTARMYDQNQLFVLAISIRTTPLNPRSAHAPSTSTPAFSSIPTTNITPAYNFDDTSVAATESTEYELFHRDTTSTSTTTRLRSDPTHSTDNTNGARQDCHIFVLDGRVNDDHNNHSNYNSNDNYSYYNTTNKNNASNSRSLTSVNYVHCIQLQPPRYALSLIQMLFDCQQDRCVIRAMFKATTAPTFDSPITTLLVTYPPSNISIVYREPQIQKISGPSNSSSLASFSASRLCSFDGITFNELQRIQNLSFYKMYLPLATGQDTCEQMDMDTDGLFDHASKTKGHENSELILGNVLHSIDCRFLQYLFKPILPRGVGGLVIPPSPHHIHQAISLSRHRSLGYRHHFNQSNHDNQGLHQSGGGRLLSLAASASGNGNVSLELQVLRLIHDCRKADARRRQQLQYRQNHNKADHTQIVRNPHLSPSTPLTTPKAASRRGTPVTATSAAITTNTIPMTPGGTSLLAIYEALGNEDEDDTLPDPHLLENNADGYTTAIVLHENASPGNHTTSTNIYTYSVNQNDNSVQNDNNDDDNNSNNTFSNTNEPGRMDENLTGNGHFCLIEQECQQHEKRWRQFLLDVFTEEDKERTPLTLSIPPKYTSTTSKLSSGTNTALPLLSFDDTSAVIVRPGCISIVTRDNITNINNKKKTPVSLRSNYISDTPPSVNSNPTSSETQMMVLEAMDHLARKLIDAVEHHSSSNLIQQIDRYLWDFVLADGHIAVDPAATVAAVEIKLRDSTTQAILSLRDQPDCQSQIKILEHALHNRCSKATLSDEDMIQVLLTLEQSSNTGSCPSTNTIHDNNDDITINALTVTSYNYNDTNSNNSNNNNYNNSSNSSSIHQDCYFQLRLLASSWVTRKLESYRLLYMARFVILAEFIQSQDVLNMALKMYLHSGAVLWSASQHISVPKMKPQYQQFSSVSGGRVSQDTPPAKRYTQSVMTTFAVRGDLSRSLSGCYSSILPNMSDRTTVLDARLIQLMKFAYSSHQKYSNVWVCNGSCLVQALSTVGLETILSFRFRQQPGLPPYAGLFSHEKLPELGILPLDTDRCSGISNEHARIVVRLVSPFVALPDSLSGSHCENEGIALHINAVREKLMAESLLETASSYQHHENTHTSMKSSHSQEMILNAFLLLRFDGTDVTDAMHRIDTLNRHATKNPKVAAMFVDFVIRAIKQLNSCTPTLSTSSSSYKDCKIALWSILFNTAIAVWNWEVAYDACTNNPSPTERINNSRRLVTAMVDAGALSQLHDKCCSSSANFLPQHLKIHDSFDKLSTLQKGNDVLNAKSSSLSSSLYGSSSFLKHGDLFGIAVVELTRMSFRDIYTHLAASEAATTWSKSSSLSFVDPPSDYNGALYSLLSSRHHWKYAAQALDLRYVNALQCLSKMDSKSNFTRNNVGLELTPDEALRRIKLIVHDLATSSIACYNALRQISDVHDQFLISGEMQQLPSVPIILSKADVDGPSRSASHNSLTLRSKRGRGTDLRLHQQQSPLSTYNGAGDDTSISHASLDGKNRINRFMTLNDLELRAVRSSVLKVLANDCFHNDSSILMFVQSAFLDSLANDVDVNFKILSKLFSLGYYREGLALAQVISTHQSRWSSNSRSTLMNGTVSPFYHALVQLITVHLIPLAFGTEAQNSFDSTNIRQRPNLAQLQLALDDCCFTLRAPYDESIETKALQPVLIAEGRFKGVNSMLRYEIQKTAMLLVEKLVVRYVHANIPIAKDVAVAILQNQRKNVGPVPSWLERILIQGITTTRLQHQYQSGSFATRRVRYSKDEHDVASNSNLQSSYLGDPVVLLNLYTQFGLYIDACRVVCDVLSNGKKTNASTTAITRMLPEKGDLTFVPYHKIDELWNRIEQQRQKMVGTTSRSDVRNLRNNDTEEVTKKKSYAELESAQKELELSLEQHFRWLRVSQQGITSARALAVS